MLTACLPHPRRWSIRRAAAAKAAADPTRPRHAAGRWALLASHDPPPDRIENFARQLLSRWGVVFRDILARETLAPAWRDLLVVLRRMEARGEIRGGRFVAGFVGEQYAQPEAIDLLRSIRRSADAREQVEVSAADPLNLAGIILPDARTSPLNSERLKILDAVGA